MGAGEVLKPIEEQHDELARLRTEPGDVVIAFAAVEPRRKDVLSMLRTLVERKRSPSLMVYGVAQAVVVGGVNVPSPDSRRRHRLRTEVEDLIRQLRRFGRSTKDFDGHMGLHAPSVGRWICVVSSHASVPVRKTQPQSTSVLTDGGRVVLQSG